MNITLVLVVMMTVSLALGVVLQWSTPVMVILETHVFSHFAPTGGYDLLLNMRKSVGAHLGKILLSDKMRALVNLFFPALNLQVFEDIMFGAVAAICDDDLISLRKQAFTLRRAEHKDTKSLSL